MYKPYINFQIEVHLFLKILFYFIYLIKSEITKNSTALYILLYITIQFSLR